jgi:hypothetical protein
VSRLSAHPSIEFRARASQSAHPSILLDLSSKGV